MEGHYSVCFRPGKLGGAGQDAGGGDALGKRHVSISLPVIARCYRRLLWATIESAVGMVVTKTTDRDSLRYTYNGTRRLRQLALGCESN